MSRHDLTQAQRQCCIDTTDQVLQRARQLFCMTLPSIDMRFDLRGSTSGMYVVQGAQRWFRFNPIIFSAYFTESLAQTIPHEVAHYVCDCRYGIKNIRPHGIEWQRVMLSLGVRPQTRSHYDIDELPLRRQRRFRYRCGCTHHQLSCTRHNKIHADQVQYHCLKCGEKLVYAGLD